MPVPFSVLKDKFRTQTKAELFNSTGGEWPSRINNSNYNNTCCARLSLAMAGTGNVANIFDGFDMAQWLIPYRPFKVQ